MTKIYYNLTNGIEFINSVPFFIRLQSTLLEAKKFDKVIYELDYNFLLDLALGYNIILIDGSSKKLQSRAIYQGIPWIKYVLERYWLNIIPKIIYVRQSNVINYFNEQYNLLSKETKQKLNYISKFLNTKNISLTGITFKTNFDSNYIKYKDILIKNEYKIS